MIAFGEGTQDRYASSNRGIITEESQWLTPNWESSSVHL